MIDSILDNRWVQRIIVFVAMINLFRSTRKVMNEFKYIKESLNANDAFFGAIATMGFVPRKWFPELITILPIDDGLTLEEVKDIANKNMIAVILNYVKDEQLLGVLTVKCEVVKKRVILTIHPSSLQMMFSDIVDFFISIIVTLCLLGLAFTYYNFM